MTTLREWLNRLRETLRPRRTDAELEEELRLHLEMTAEHERRGGGSAGGAGRTAAIRSGGVAQAMEILREQRGLPWLDSAGRDLQFAWRAAVRNRGFTLVATATLAAGVALCLTVLAIVNAYVIRAMPYPAADRLYSVVLSGPGQQTPRGLSNIDWTVLDDVVDDRIAWDLDMFYVLGGAYPEATPGAWVTPGFVRGLGIRAALGRVLEAADFTTRNPTAVMISHRLWVGRFGGDSAAVGRTLQAYVSDRPDEPETLTVVGVLPADFWHVNNFTDVLAPLRAPSQPYLVRLRAGVDAAITSERVTALVRASDATIPDGWRATVVPMQARYAEEMRPLLKAAGISVGLVLLIACANVAVLLLVRSVRRRHEIAIRLALGASRARLVRLLGFEALLIGGLATALGLGLSALLTRGMAALVEQRLGRRLPGGESALAVDGTVLLAALAGCVLLTTALTLAPLVTLWTTAITPALKAGGRGSTEGRTSRRLRSALIVGEIAAALALLVGSALLTQSSLRMLRMERGFETTGVLTTSVGLRLRAYPDASSRADFFARLLRRLDERTGTAESAALSDASPLQQIIATRVETVDGRRVSADAAVARVSAGYFAMLRIPFRDGGSFASQDRPGGERVVVVSESLARRLWPGARAVGQLLRIPADDDTTPADDSPRVVVGVVQDVRQADYDDGRVHTDANQFDAYVPFLQEAGRFAFVFTRHFSSAPDALRLLVAEIDPQAAVQPPNSLAAALEETRSGPRQLAWVLSGFAAFATLLALLGVYSVIAYGVHQRQREIGVRLVVGADARGVTRLFVREGIPLVAGGLAAGILAAAALGQLLRSQLFGVQPLEPGVLATATAVFAACGWLALWWPARRAAFVDPAHVLKDE